LVVFLRKHATVGPWAEAEFKATICYYKQRRRRVNWQKVVLKETAGAWGRQSKRGPRARTPGDFIYELEKIR